MTTSSKSLFSHRVARGLAVGLLLLGAILRLIDSADPPLDFHPTRQLRNMLVARGIYYRILPDAPPEQREKAETFANSVGQFEPPIIETIVAFTWRWTGGENILVPRVYETFFWLLAGIALYALARRLASEDAALVPLAFYLVLPFSVQASRSFQPDPLMTALFVIGLYFLYRWTESQEWKWALLAGAFLGLATLVKIVIAFFVAAAAIAAILLVYGWKRFWKSPQVWAMAAEMILPAFAYYILGIGARSEEYFFSWSVALFHLVTTTKFYLRWMTFLGSLFGLPVLYLSLLGVFLLPRRGRALLFSIWIGYLLYGLTLPFQMYTHSYYHIQLIPILALGLAVPAKLIFENAASLKGFWKAGFLALIFAAVAYPSWVARSVLVARDYRNEPAAWHRIAEAIPEDGKTIALTQDYGYRLMVYGWKKVALWPLSTELTQARGNTLDARKIFEEKTNGARYFLITAFHQFNAQPDLQEILNANYPILAEGDGYLLYDLGHPK